MSGEETGDLIMSKFLANFEPDGTTDGKVKQKNTKIINIHS